MTTPTPEDLRLAALWCDQNEGDEAPALERVARWLDRMADEKEVRDAARAAGVPVDRVRKAMGQTEPPQWSVKE